MNYSLMGIEVGDEPKGSSLDKKALLWLRQHLVALMGDMNVGLEQMKALQYFIEQINEEIKFAEEE